MASWYDQVRNVIDNALDWAWYKFVGWVLKRSDEKR